VKLLFNNKGFTYLGDAGENIFRKFEDIMETRENYIYKSITICVLSNYEGAKQRSPKRATLVTHMSQLRRSVKILHRRHEWDRSNKNIF